MRGQIQDTKKEKKKSRITLREGAASTNKRKVTQPKKRVRTVRRNALKLLSSKRLSHRQEEKQVKENTYQIKVTHKEEKKRIKIGY